MAKSFQAQPPKAEPKTAVEPKVPAAVSEKTEEPVVEQPRQKSDRYRVRGPASVMAGERLYEAGSIVELSEADALSVMDYLESI